MADFNLATSRFSVKGQAFAQRHRAASSSSFLHSLGNSGDKLYTDSHLSSSTHMISRHFFDYLVIF